MIMQLGDFATLFKPQSKEGFTDTMRGIVDEIKEKGFYSYDVTNPRVATLFDIESDKLDGMSTFELEKVKVEIKVA